MVAITTPNKFIVREACASDFQTICHFLSKLVPTSAESQVALGVRRVFDQTQLGKYYVVEDRRHPIGMYMLTNEWDDIQCGVKLWVRHVFISEGWRGRGVFDQILTRIRSEAFKMKDVVDVQLIVDNENRRAIRAYEKRGFVSEAKRMRFTGLN